MKKYSNEARELLSSIELYDIKAGSGQQGPPPPACGVLCTTCIGCSVTCTACSSKMMDVIVIP